MSITILSLPRGPVVIPILDFGGCDIKWMDKAVTRSPFDKTSFTLLFGSYFTLLASVPDSVPLSVSMVSDSLRVCGSADRSYMP